MEENIQKLILLGLTEKKIHETLKNTALTNTILNAISFIPKGHNFGSGEGFLIYHVCTKIKQQILVHLEFLVQHIVNRKLDSTRRVDMALEFLLAHGSSKLINTVEFDKVCGVGIEVTLEEIDRAVYLIINKNKDAIKSQRYRFNIGILLAELRNTLPWADGKAMKNELDVQLFNLLGPKTEDDLVHAIKTNNKPYEKIPVILSPEVTNKGVKTITEMMKSVHFHRPGDNHKTEGYIITEHTNKLLSEHLKRTGGIVRTRFPPEPNGILHIGHAKAININFGYALANNGTCFLRYDDTNPEKEEEFFFVGIKEMVRWLGYEPYKISHSSDYFFQLYQWALLLIAKGLAYVCHQTANDMKGFNPEPSKWRDRPVEENLSLFEDMKNGKIDEGSATLRMKITLEEGKLDPVAYRIKFIPHHRTGNDWCIYPTYDYTHCLCDSIEDITHSLCTKEFQSRRSSYYWLCNALNIYCPVQWEYGRLNVNFTVVSKRKINRLITEGIVADFDDPRLFTLSALQRRGFPSEAINSFCAQMGVTGAQTSIDPSLLEACVRDVLNVTSPRALVVLEPLKVRIKNFPHSTAIEIAVPNFPNNLEKGMHSVWLDEVLYIERKDFVEVHDKNYRRLSPTQAVGLKYAGIIIEAIDVVKDLMGNITELVCICHDCSPERKPKAFIQWVSKPRKIDVRLYEKLFYHKNPEDLNEVPNGFVSDCNHNSFKAFTAYGDASLKNAKVYDKFQFERVGYFCVDPDSSEEHLIFNRTVTLKEDGGKI